MTGWILCERDPFLKAIGIFSTQTAAEDAAIDGRYVLIPFNANDLYENLLSEGNVGAIYFEASGLQTQVANLTSTIDALQAAGQVMNNKINQLIDAVQDLVERVEILEGQGG